DGSGSPVLNSPLSITVTGANPQQLTAITDNTGVASFSYQGVNTGDDRAQATMFMAAMGDDAVSNELPVHWNFVNNAPPVVDAGPDQTVDLPNAATLNGSVSDDGLPIGAAVTIQWSQVSGPGTVTFSNPNSPVTQASFSALGHYVLQLSASDTQFTTTATTKVLAATPLEVHAGPPQTITLPASAALSGTASAHGVPLTVVQWSKLTGPGTVVFSDPTLAITQA